MYEKGQILEVIAEHDEQLNLERGDRFLVLEAPGTIPVLPLYCLQPLGLAAIADGYIQTPGISLSKQLLEEQEYSVVARLGHLDWMYFRDLSKPIEDLLARNPELATYFLG